jgi:hypothetical protein
VNAFVFTKEELDRIAKEKAENERVESERVATELKAQKEKERIEELDLLADLAETETEEQMLSEGNNMNIRFGRKRLDERNK